MNESSPAFRNDAIDPHSLPDFSRLTLNPVTGGYAPYAMTTGAAIALAVAIGATMAGWAIWEWRVAIWLGALALLLLPLALLHGYLDARHRGWALREHDLVSAYGVIWRRTVILPLARIQHVETASGPVERLFGLMRLQCFSAGGASADMVVEGLNPETALRIRSHILSRIRQDGNEEARTGE